MGDVLAFPGCPLPAADPAAPNRRRTVDAQALAESDGARHRLLGELEAAVAKLDDAAGVVQDHTCAVDPVDMPWAEVVPIDGVDHVRVMFLLDGDWWCRLFSPAGKPIGHPFRPERD